MAQMSYSSETPCRIVLIDDHPLFRRGLTLLIKHETDCCVCGEAGDAESGMALLDEVRPDLVVLDLSLPGGSGIGLLKRMKEKHSHLKVLVVSMHDEAHYAERALRAGAMGYIMKEVPPEVIVKGIRRVLAGEICISAEMKNRFLDPTVSASRAVTSPIDLLTDRELEILEMIGRGCTVRTIAQTLGLSVKTVETHRANVKEKLRLESSADLIRYSMRWLEDR